MRARAGELSVAVVLLAGATSIAWGPALSGEFLSWDDGRFVDDDPAIRSLGVAHLARIFGTIHAEAYHPIHRLANAVDFALWGHHAAGWHATSLLLWVAALVAVVALLRRLGVGPWAALAGALVVGLHPLQAEPVAWISGKKDVLAMLFFASAATAALGAQSIRSRRMLLAVGLHVLGVLSKTSVVALPAFLLLADVLVRGRSLRDAARRAVPFALVSLAAGIPVLFVWSGAQMIRPAPSTGLPGRLAWIGQAILHHGQTMLWPRRLSILYPIDASPRLDLRAVAGLTLLFGSLASLRWHHLGRGRLGIAWVGVALLPVANIVPLAFFVADRYASLALLGLGWLFALGVEELFVRLPPGRHALVLAGVAAVAIGLGALSRARAADFHDDQRLLRAAVAAQPDSYFAHMKLGEVLRDAGDLRGSIRQYRAAIALEPGRSLAHGGLLLAVARAEARRRQVDERMPDRALARYMRDFEEPEALVTLAGSLREAGLGDTALLPLERALELDPWPDARLRAEAGQAIERGDRKTAILLLHHVREPDATVRDALRELTKGLQ